MLIDKHQPHHRGFILFSQYPRFHSYSCNYYSDEIFKGVSNESNTVSAEVFVKDQVSDWHWARDADGGASQEIVMMAIVVVMV